MRSKIVFQMCIAVMHENGVGEAADGQELHSIVNDSHLLANELQTALHSTLGLDLVLLQ